MRVPLGKEDLTMMFLDDAYALAVGDERYLVSQSILSTILLDGSIQRSILK